MPPSKTTNNSLSRNMTLGELCDALRAKPSVQPVKVRNVLQIKTESDLGIYDEYMRRCNKQMTLDVKELNFYNRSTISYLRCIAEACNKVDTQTKENILFKIERLFSTMDDNYYVFNDPLVHIDSNNNKKISDLLINKQVKHYMREAFTGDLFEDAGTKISDAADVLQLAHNIYSGDLDSARKHRNFDTIVREDIPMTVWKWMEKHVR